MRLIRTLVPLFLGGCISADVQVVAHRGASYDAPEHTFAAWDLALEHSADWIEQDLQMTRDGQLIVLHDDSLDRTATGPSASCSGLVRERTLAELGACEVGSWFSRKNPGRARAAYASERIPTLEAVLARYGGRARFYIEIKSSADAPGMEDSLLVRLRRHRLVGRGANEGRVLVQSFTAASLLRLRTLEPRLQLVQLIADSIAANQLEATLDSIAKYAVGIGPSREILNKTMVDAAHARGLVVHPYTVNAEPTMEFFRAMGVNGMFTDRPDLLRRLLDR